MIFIRGPIAGAVVIEPERRSDERGFFARSWCAQEFATQGLPMTIAQVNVAQTLRQGTVRGLHLQTPPHEETKVVSCTRGAIFDVLVDLRPGSATFGRWFGVELGAADGRMLHVPAGCAHGYQALCDDVAIQYLASHPYAPAHATGLRFDDPEVGIAWPVPVTLVSAADRNWGTLAALRAARAGR